MNLRHLYLSTAMAITMATGAFGQQVGLRPPLPQNNTPPTTQTIVVKNNNINYKLEQTTTPNGGRVVSHMMRQSDGALTPETTLRFGPDSAFIGVDATIFGGSVYADYTDPTTPTLFVFQDVSEELNGFLYAAQKANEFDGSRASLKWQIGHDRKLVANQSPELEISFANQNKKGEWQEKARVVTPVDQDGTVDYNGYAATLRNVFKEAGLEYPQATVNAELEALYKNASNIAKNQSLWGQVKSTAQNVLALMGLADKNPEFTNLIKNATAAINGTRAFDQNKNMVNKADIEAKFKIGDNTYEVTKDEGFNSVVKKYDPKNPQDKGQEVGWVFKDRHNEIVGIQVNVEKDVTYFEQLQNGQKIYAHIAVEKGKQINLVRDSDGCMPAIANLPNGKTIMLQPAQEFLGKIGEALLGKPLPSGEIAPIVTTPNKPQGKLKK